LDRRKVVRIFERKRTAIFSLQGVKKKGDWT